MAHVTLPAHHRDEDLALAGALATLLESDELYVAWSLDEGISRPVVRAVLRDPEPAFQPPQPRRGLFGRLRRRPH